VVSLQKEKRNERRGDRYCDVHKDLFSSRSGGHRMEGREQESVLDLMLLYVMNNLLYCVDLCAT
jgi:hypothetical protein